MRIKGRILAIQEGRFRLLTDTGQVYLLTLAHDAPLDSHVLEAFVKRQTRLAVDFTGEPNLVGGVAHQLQPENER